MTGAPPPQFPDRQRRPTSNTGLIVGIVLGALCCLGVPIIAAILLPVFASARHAAQTTTCLSNIKQLALASQIYATDNNERFPVVAVWTEVLPTTSGVSAATHLCPVSKAQFSYAMDERLSGVSTASIPDPALKVLLYEPRQPSQNASGKFEQDEADPGLHNGKNSRAYADGAAKRKAPGSPP